MRFEALYIAGVFLFQTTCIRKDESDFEKLTRLLSFHAEVIRPSLQFWNGTQCSALAILHRNRYSTANCALITFITLISSTDRRFFTLLSQTLRTIVLDKCIVGVVGRGTYSQNFLTKVLPPWSWWWANVELRLIYPLSTFQSSIYKHWETDS